MSGVRLEALRQALDAGERQLPVVMAAWWLLFGGPMRLSKRRREQLERMLATADRVSGLRSGAEWLLDDMEDHAERLREAERFGEDDKVERPGSLAFFVAPFRQTVRHWRRTWRAKRREARQ